MSKNLFALTERLPKNKYRQRSNDLRRDVSQDSMVGLPQSLVTPNLASFKQRIDRGSERSRGSLAAVGDNEGDND